MTPITTYCPINHLSPSSSSFPTLPRLAFLKLTLSSPPTHHPPPPKEDTNFNTNSRNLDTLSTPHSSFFTSSGPSIYLVAFFPSSLLTHDLTVLPFFFVCFFFLPLLLLRLLLSSPILSPLILLRNHILSSPPPPPATNLLDHPQTSCDLTPSLYSLPVPTATHKIGQTFVPGRTTLHSPGAGSASIFLALWRALRHSHTPPNPLSTIHAQSPA